MTLQCPECKKDLREVIVYREMKARYAVSGEKIGTTEVAKDDIDLECGECKTNVVALLVENGVSFEMFMTFGERFA